MSALKQETIGGATFAKEGTLALVTYNEAQEDNDVSDLPIRDPIKRVSDIVVAFTMLVVALPVMMPIVFLIRRDGGPALFGHTRVGRDGQTFRCLKFRSMVVNANDVLRDLLERDEAAREEWANTQKLRHDPRITGIGRFIRATSLDELPQLLNILRGEMSLVGPRPIVRAEVERYGDDIKYYYATRPGLTGLWQVSGRSNTSYARRVALDSAYVRDWTIWSDVKILLKTIPAVLRRDGAH